MNSSKKRNIVCDLDGTLIKNDLTAESLIHFIKKNIFNFFVLFFWASRGKSYLKSKVAEIVDFEIGDFLFEHDLTHFYEQNWPVKDGGWDFKLYKGRK